VQIKKLEDNDWVEKQLNKPYVSFENSFASAVAHDFHSTTPPEHNDKTIYPIPRVVFRMFDYTDVPEVSWNIKQ
jgi:nuclear cap-binding protein subunit 1